MVELGWGNREGVGVIWVREIENEEIRRGHWNFGMRERGR